MNDLESYHILRANEWNFEIALDLTLEGAYNHDIIQNMIQHSNGNNNGEQTNVTSSSLRRRNAPTSSTMFSAALSSSTPLSDNDSNTSAINDNENSNNNDNNNSLFMIPWNAATWLLRLPYILIMNTLNTIYDFFISMIYPTLRRFEIYYAMSFKKHRIYFFQIMIQMEQLNNLFANLRKNMANNIQHFSVVPILK